MAHIRWVFLLLIVLAVPASAADVVYPQGSRVGLVPPPGLRASTEFPGFEDRQKNVAVMLSALPADAFGEIEKSDSAESLKKQGATLETRESLTLPAGKALLVIGNRDVEGAPLHTWLLVVGRPELTLLVTVRIPEAAKTAYPDTAIRAAFTTIALRPEVPVEEQLGLLPFKLSDLAGFKVGGVLAGRAVILTDTATDPGDKTVEPHIIVALAPGAPSEASGRDDFAREVFGSIPNLKDVRITASESQRIGGQPGHEIMATAKEPTTDADITIVQWLRFGGGGYLHLVGVAATPGWTQAYARFRSVRDGIEPK
jgi:hypothetical protein